MEEEKKKGQRTRRPFHKNRSNGDREHSEEIKGGASRDAGNNKRVFRRTDAKGANSKQDGVRGSERKYTTKKESAEEGTTRKKTLYKSYKGHGDIIQNRINARKPKQAPPEQKDDDTTRLNKFISNAGICSRRDADKLISVGAVTVNGEVVTTMGYKVKPGDVVAYGGTVLQSEPKRYFLLNKPKDYITTVDDPHERNTVMMLMRGCCKERIYPVGRLDRNTTGLLLFTNDGELSRKLTHPSSNVYKIYQVECDKPVTRQDIQHMLDGVELEDGMVAVDDVQYQDNGKNKRVVGVALHSGKNRVVRRIFESLGYEVVKLDRVVFAGLTKKDLPRGRYRELTQQEISYLMMI